MAFNLFTSAIQPLLQLVSTWINHGALTDDYKEFFIIENSSSDSKRPENFWYNAFDILNNQVPIFIDSKICQKITNAGKSVAFLKDVCKDEQYLTFNYRIVVKKFCSREFKLCEIIPDMVHKCYYKASKNLIKCLREKYHLNIHFIMMRNYLLLGQGDFIRHLLDQMKSELDRDASLVYPHNLNSIVEASLRLSSSHPEVSDYLDRLRVKLLDCHPNEPGWEIFVLDYTIEDHSPLKAVFSTGIVRQYHRLFQFLWRAKRMEHIVTKSWTDLTFQTKVANRKLPEAVSLLHNCQLVLQEQLHFIAQIQYYITFEVLQCSWADFQEEYRRVQDFDQLLLAHEDFLKKLTESCLLTEKSSYIATSIRSTFNSIKTFQTVLKLLYDDCEKETNRRITTAKQTGWEYREDETQHRKQFKKYVDTTLLPKVHTQKTSWSSMVITLLGVLLNQENENLRSLAWRLDYSRYYYQV